ncbi:hypothetical protein JRO89_XS11G0040100 [Xanthoceras sorbifolium]|uniref:Integrase catalytic domain-containing protein n=1 Tax=Xanthoceras sorbifolium TaxID=99658 RepID=A0ABQ8HEM2_9ROSI|nr:hypothetical protein JRO89_XS11G0040100 [Xanthoceras sorbifolium]
MLTGPFAPPSSRARLGRAGARVAHCPNSTFSSRAVHRDLWSRSLNILGIQKALELQLGTAIKCLQTDMGGEYLCFAKTLASLGIKLQFSCPYTHQQNGVPERKHRHIAELGLTLLSHATMPIKFWCEAFMIAAFIINSLPSSREGCNTMEFIGLKNIGEKLESRVSRFADIYLLDVTMMIPPCTSDEHGDWPRPLPVIPELENALDITKRKEGDITLNSWGWEKIRLNGRPRTWHFVELRSAMKGFSPQTSFDDQTMFDGRRPQILSRSSQSSFSLLRPGNFWLIEPPICQQIPNETLWYLDLAMVSSRTMHIAWDDAGCLCPGGDLFNYAAPGEEANGFGDVLGWADDSSILSKGDTVDILNSEKCSANLQRLNRWVV